ncbi:transcriptional regulator [Enterococcus hulanensis]|uniref:transcriptional regulator n=1 Tax=Enterococcus hulanensis TaxID=2559929 RepID=UPI001A8ECEC4|nr:transcriptional regulator [Enterococcus hulanensis]MBO0456306.1 transcriptional regulator [Enterococcus hulanensis]
MEKIIRAHIRKLLWNYKTIERTLNQFTEILSTNDEVIETYPYLNHSEEEWTINQLVFNKFFYQTVEELLSDSTPEIVDIFQSKYLKGYPTKENAIVAYEICLSESTVKRRDLELLKEISKRLGWS